MICHEFNCCVACGSELHCGWTAAMRCLWCWTSLRGVAATNGQIVSLGLLSASRSSGQCRASAFGRSWPSLCRSTCVVRVGAYVCSMARESQPCSEEEPRQVWLVVQVIPRRPESLRTLRGCRHRAPNSSSYDLPAKRPVASVEKLGRHISCCAASKR